LRDLVQLVGAGLVLFDGGDEFQVAPGWRPATVPAENDRTYQGFNFFHPQEEKLFQSLASSEFNISGFQNKDLRRRLSDRNSGQISRTVKRLRVHGLIKKVGHTYKYYLTALGKQVIALGLKLKHLYIIPTLSAQPAC
jgi:hypothetical protein